MLRERNDTREKYQRKKKMRKKRDATRRLHEYRKIMINEQEEKIKREPFTRMMAIVLTNFWCRHDSCQTLDKTNFLESNLYDTSLNARCMQRRSKTRT